MKLRSPVKGVIEDVMVEKGEAVDSLQEVLRVVSIDRLVLDAHVRRSKAWDIKVGQEVWVGFLSRGTGVSGKESGPTVKDGKVTHIAAVGKGASSSRRVRVEMNNPTSRAAGERVWLFLTKPTVESLKGLGEAWSDFSQPYSAPGKADRGNGVVRKRRI